VQLLVGSSTVLGEGGNSDVHMLTVKMPKWGDIFSQLLLEQATVTFFIQHCWPLLNRRCYMLTSQTVTVRAIAVLWSMHWQHT
jgi:hypothetical protein